MRDDGSGSSQRVSHWIPSKLNQGRGGGYGGRDYDRGYDRMDRGGDREYSSRGSGGRDRDYYSSSRGDDRYAGREERRGGGGADYPGFDRPARGATDSGAGYSAPADAPAGDAGSRRGYTEDRYERR